MDFTLTEETPSTCFVMTALLGFTTTPSVCLWLLLILSEGLVMDTPMFPRYGILICELGFLFNKYQGIEKVDNNSLEEKY